ncbi:MAG: VOC family protein [Flavobacteriales bacterium]|nr:VOC family protein [Flavobacteriales bacterium]
MLTGTFHIAFATTDLKRIKAFYGKLLGCPEGRSSDNWVDYNFFGHQLTIQEVPKLIKTSRIYNPKSPASPSGVPSEHWGIVLSMMEWKRLRDKLKKVGVPFLIEPRVVMKGQVGEQRSLFIEDPDGHAIEFKAFEDPGALFAKE